MRRQPSSPKIIQLLSPNPNQLVCFNRKANSKGRAHDERCDCKLLPGRKSGGQAKTQSVSQAYRFVTLVPPYSSGRNVSTRSPPAFTRRRSSQAKTACSVTHCFRSFA